MTLLTITSGGARKMKKLTDNNTLSRYLSVGAQIKELEKERDQLKAKITKALGTSTAGLSSRYMVELKEIEQERFDGKSFEKVHPDLWRQFLARSSYKRLTVKERVEE
jgi:predicted phage-related endonuclease